MDARAALQQALQTRWKAWNELERLAYVPLAWLMWRTTGVSIGAGWACYGLPIVQRHTHSALIIGTNAHFRSTVRSNPLGANHPCVLSTRKAGAELRIGDHFGMTGGAIVCETRVSIGDRVTMGANSTITDTDFHPLDPDHRRDHPTDGASKPVTIEDDVFIGMSALILKGVTLGQGCVVGGGSVVSRDVPPRAVVAGNPARVVRML
jgi:acetyltransferase-like isoleucine patch superfamily enzyme